MRWLDRQKEISIFTCKNEWNRGIERRRDKETETNNLKKTKNRYVNKFRDKERERERSLICFS